MKTTLVIPPFCDFYDTPGRRTNLGASTVLDLLHRAGVETDFIDLPSLNKKRTSLLPESLHHLKPLMMQRETGPTAFFSYFYRFGPDPEESAGVILETKPDLLLISLFAWCYGEDTIALCRALKEKSNVPIYIGGAGATVHPEWFLDTNAVDGILCGEAETIIPGFLNFLQNGSDGPPPGLLLRNQHHTAAQRTTSRTITPAATICQERPEGSLISISLSRGCPAGCSFCSIALCHGKRFRTAPLEKLSVLLDRLPARGKPTCNFEDDNLLMDKPYFREAVRICRSRFPEARFAAENGLDYRLLDGDTIDFLTHAGFRRINLSLGTVSEKATAAQKRHLNLEKYEEILTKLHDRGFPVTTFFICGLPGDSPEDTIRTLLYLADKPTVIGISPFYALPGLPGFPPKNFTEGPDRSRGMALWPWSGTHTTAELMTAFRLTRFINLLKSKPEEPLVMELIETTLETGQLHTIIKKGKQKKVAAVPNLQLKMQRTVLEELAMKSP